MKTALQRTYLALVGFLLAPLAAGLHAAELKSIGSGDTAVDVCQIDLAKDTLRMFWRAPNGGIYGSFDGVQEALQASGERLLCASNGGIFGKDLHPIGLYVEAGQVERGLNTRQNGFGNFYMQPNGVFMLLADHKAAIMVTEDVSADWHRLAPTMRYATQSGPILLRAGHINAAFTEGSGNRVFRNGVCVKSASEVLLAKSRWPINFYDFARVLRDAGCSDALYLDGSISELYPVDRGGASQRFSVMLGVVVPARPFAVHAPAQSMR